MKVLLIDRRVEKPEDDLVIRQLSLFQKLVLKTGRPGWVFNLVLVDDKTMTQLNDQFREKDAVTDVLSFSYLLEDGPADACDLAGGDACAAHDLWLDPIAMETGQDETAVMGEIILAPSFVTVRCQQRNWPVESEFPLLVVHGALHLLGWDHCQEEEKRAMQNLEKSILAELDLSHPLLDEEKQKG